MRDLKILLVLVAFVGLTYYGVEPYAHHVMHPEVTPADFSFKDIKEPNNITVIKGGDAAKGKELATAQCVSCHAISKDGVQAPMSAADAVATYGIVPPDLSKAGAIYDHTYLAGFIQNPEVVAKGKAGKYAMPNLGISPEDAGHITAYLASIAPKEVSAKETFEEACVRCHNMKYDGITTTTNNEAVKKYMGAVPPDLSQMIISKGEHYLHGFINDPQKLLPGTSMPRVGLTKESQEKVVAYMEKVGDPKKEERNSLGLKVLIYMGILTVLTYLWKVKIYKEVH